MCISARYDSFPGPCMPCYMYAAALKNAHFFHIHSSLHCRDCGAYLEERIYMWKEIIIALIKSFGCCIWPVFLRF